MWTLTNTFHVGAVIDSVGRLLATAEFPATSRGYRQLLAWMRGHGELAHFRQVPFGRYYGLVDATPLFLVLLQAYTEATGDRATAVRLEAHARAGLGHSALTRSGAPQA